MHFTHFALQNTAGCTLQQFALQNAAESVRRGCACQAADIGVGVMGREGRQAVNNSDFAVSQFRCAVSCPMRAADAAHASVWLPVPPKLSRSYTWIVHQVCTRGHRFLTRLLLVHGASR